MIVGIARNNKSKRPSSPITETDLYAPVRDWLVAQGYTVRGEVKDCDIAAVRGDDLIAIELKRSFNGTLLVQAAQRQILTDSVYVALPRPGESLYSKKWKGIRHLLRRLELGLILVAVPSPAPSIEIVFHPLPYNRKKNKRARRAILREIEGRTGDYNRGGSVNRKLVTAYRENAIHIACLLERFGPLSPKQLRGLGTGGKTSSILYDNHYGWFERIAHGLYALKPTALNTMTQFSEPLKTYRQLAMDIKQK